MVENITGGTFTPPVTSGSFPLASDLAVGAASGRMYIKYAYNNTSGGLQRPIIFVDGYDPSTTTVCDPDFAAGGIDRTIRYGSIGWDVLVTGLSPDKYDDDPLAEAPLMIDDMLSEGFDVIFLDFLDGATWIQKNGLVLEEAILRINQLKRDNGSTFENIVVGNSMGGQIARWALVDMESKGINHCVGLTVYNDSPHQGANIPLSIQAFGYFSAYYGKTPNPDFWDALLRPTPQQLLKLHFNSVLGGIHTPGGTNTQALHDGFYNGLGYPQNCRNVALAYGSGTQVTQFPAGKHLFHADRWAGSIAQFALDMDLYASDRAYGPNLLANIAKIRMIKKESLPLKFDNMRFYRTGDRSVAFEVTREEGGSVYQTISNTHTFPVSLDNWDRAPGNQRKDVSRALVDGIYDAIGPGFSVQSFVESTTFMPTTSLLDIPTDNLLFDVIGNIDPDNPNSLLTPFSKVYYVDGGNLDHVQITEEIRDWVKLRLTSGAKTLSPGVLNQQYNYANHDQSDIPNITVEAGGRLCINNNGVAAYPNNSLPNDNKTVFERRLTACGTNITVEAGGQIQMGQGWSNNGILHVDDGAVVHIKQDGILRINNQSKLHIAEGGKLILEAGARIMLVDSDSQIEIEGTLELQGQPDFSGEGYWHFIGDNQLVYGPNLATWRIQGVGKGRRMLVLDDCQLYTPNGRGIEFRAGRVEYNNSAVLVRNLGYAAGVNVEFVAEQNGFSEAIKANYTQGLQFYGCDFTGFGTGIEAMLVPSIRIVQCNFRTNSVGIHHNLAGATVDLISSTFTAIF